MLEVQFADPLEILGVFFVRGGIAALDEIEAEVVQAFGQFQLVEQREADALGLGAVAERGVVDFDASHVNTSTVKRTENSGIRVVESADLFPLLPRP